jgi:uncharacterized protein
MQAIVERDRGPWIQTFTGRQFFYGDPRLADINIVDIAQALSQQCRYAGHTKRFYSVAEHSVAVASRFADPELRMIGLLHDATEAYMLDLPKPLKDMLPDYSRYENALWGVIAEKFGLPGDIPAEIHEADRRMLVTERPFLFRNPHPWPAFKDVQPYADVIPLCLSPEQAYLQFRETFVEIQGQR